MQRAGRAGHLVRRVPAGTVLPPLRAALAGTGPDGAPGRRLRRLRPAVRTRKRTRKRTRTGDRPAARRLAAAPGMVPGLRGPGLPRLRVRLGAPGPEGQLRCRPALRGAVERRPGGRPGRGPDLRPAGPDPVTRPRKPPGRPPVRP